ncbi:hypothetical protein DFH11DRAFT_1758362 [Phellopilus nigrolimitatus]|nr:hypothetical protein DFH11DRAFT_1758362 [Phellopilus nigrolimitatus]
MSTALDEPTTLKNPLSRYYHSYEDFCEEAVDALKKEALEELLLELFSDEEYHDCAITTARTRSSSAWNGATGNRGRALTSLPLEYILSDGLLAARAGYRARRLHLLLPAHPGSYMRLKGPVNRTERGLLSTHRRFRASARPEACPSAPEGAPASVPARQLEASRTRTSSGSVVGDGPCWPCTLRGKQASHARPRAAGGGPAGPARRGDGGPAWGAWAEKGGLRAGTRGLDSGQRLSLARHAARAEPYIIPHMRAPTLNPHTAKAPQPPSESKPLPAAVDAGPAVFSFPRPVRAPTRSPFEFVTMRAASFVLALAALLACAAAAPLPAPVPNAVWRRAAAPAPLNADWRREADPLNADWRRAPLNADW